MPLYTYECPQCGHVTELFCAVRDYKETMPCEDCGSDARRQFLPVGVQTDATFLAGVGTLLDQCGGDKREVRRLVHAARQQGYNPNMHDYYLPSIAESTGDPAAFVPASGGRGHVRRVAEQKQITVRGAVEYEAPPRPPMPKKKLADRVVRRLVKRAVKQDPGLKDKPKAALCEQIVDRHAHQND